MNALFIFLLFLTFNLTGFCNSDPINGDELAQYYDNYCNQIEQEKAWEELSKQFHLGLFPITKVYNGETMKQLQEEMVKECVKNLGLEKNALVLDVGCGIGGPMLTILSSHPNVRIDGIDISDKCLANASKLMRENQLEKRCHVLNMDAHAMSFKEGVYDCAFSLETLEHMNQKLVFKEIYRVLKDRGRLSVCVFCKKGVLNQKDELFLQSQEHFSLINKKEYFDLLQTIGFQNIEIIDLTDRIYPNFVYFCQDEHDLRNLIEEKKVGYIKINAVAIK